VSKLSDIRARSRIGDLIEGQPQHLGLALLLAYGAVALIGPDPGAPRLLGLTSVGWAYLSIALALIHQAVVALVFRLQLHRNLMTRLFGARDMAVWGAIFMPLLVARPLTVLLTGLADSVPITAYRGVEITLGIALVGAAIWAMHSVLVHFTLPRALGGDHFRDSYAGMPLVRDGAFKYTSNAMYGVVFLGLWGIALLCGSWVALILALFQHCYIWVHMYCTENADMGWIYGSR
jgi:protein-S-isoprenylcysteine O-methyltransferase Ste14